MSNKTRKTDRKGTADCRAGQSAAGTENTGADKSCVSTFSISHIPTGDNARNETQTPYNEAVVRCLQIAYRRGRAILEAEARAAAAAAGE